MAREIRQAGERRPVHITFQTGAEGVKLPAHLKAQYPDEMTIVLQHEFRGLKVTGDVLDVGLWFNRKPERLVVPFHALRLLRSGGAGVSPARSEAVGWTRREHASPTLKSSERHVHIAEPEQFHHHAVAGLQPHRLHQTPGQNDLPRMQTFSFGGR